MFYCHASHSEVFRTLARSLEESVNPNRCEAFSYKTGASAIRLDKLYFYFKDTQHTLSQDWPAIGNPSKRVELICKRYSTPHRNSTLEVNNCNFSAYTSPNRHLHQLDAIGLYPSDKKYGVIIKTEGKVTEKMIKEILKKYQITELKINKNGPKGIITALKILAKL